MKTTGFPERFPATEMDRRAAKALHGCTFVPGTATKRFARDMYAASAMPGWKITDKQRVYLFTACHRFRRQIRDREVLLFAEAFKDLAKAGRA